VKIISGTLNSEEAPRFDEHTIAQLLADRSIYVVSPKPGYCPAFILENYDLLRTGILWQVTEARIIR
jgi:hypothetical protein